MLGCVYLILAALLGREITHNFLPEQRMREKGITPLWVTFAASFGSGVLLMTWAVYIAAWLLSVYSEAENPLFGANLMVMAAVSKENKNRFQILAHTDSLTDIYNRYGFDEAAEKIIAQNPKTHFVAALFDIDDFKFINDVYGHAYGDRALKSLADNMKAFFPPDVLLGRNGGDEFCILLPDCTLEEADAKLNQFTRLPKTFSYKGTEHHFSISLGYAEYPAFASNHSQLMRCADAALYEIKLHGKNGCMAYREDLQSGVRKQLGFALKDVSEHLPGAFIIYRADKEDDELFYANQEFLHMTGYKDMDELFRLTNKSFHNLIREDEQKQIEASIWEQIDSGNENDYIHFHLRKADGSYLSVLDHGRIVENQQYGRVFYVLFMDWKDMHIHSSPGSHP